MKTEIIYEDKSIMVVRKPAGLATQTAKVGQQDVVSELKNYLRQSYLGIIHRLDQPVEGLLVFAKTRDTAAELTAQLRRQGEGGTLHKQYYAVLCGKPSENQGRLVDYLYKDGSGTAVVADAGGGPGMVDVQEDAEGGPGTVGVQADVKQSGAKRAALSWRILQTIDSPAEMALAEISLETGRFHQIRAQLAHYGYPLLGDVKYGDDRTKGLSQRLCIKNAALCACRLEFVHPAAKKIMSFQTDPRGEAFSYFLIFAHT